MMSEFKYIYWQPNVEANDKGERFAEIHLLVSDPTNVKKPSISVFREMAEELRKTFPQATEDQICAGKVYESMFVLGHLIVAWEGYIPKKDYPGWSQNPGLSYEQKFKGYRW